VLAFAQVHGENGDAIAMAQKTTFDAGITGPEGHSISRPSYLEVSVVHASDEPRDKPCHCSCIFATLMTVHQLLSDNRRGVQQCCLAVKHQASAWRCMLAMLWTAHIEVHLGCKCCTGVLGQAMCHD